MKSLQRLLQELDFYKYTKYDQGKIDEILAELEKVKDTYTSLVSPNQQYIPYPDLTDPDFYDKIYYKKEFNKTIAPSLSTDQTFDEIVKGKCSSERFQLTNNQIFLKNFLSPSTPYNGILLFHGVGVGKCFAKNTPIMMYNGLTKNVQDIKMGDQVMGDDSNPRNVISLATQSVGNMYIVQQDQGIDYIVNSDHILSLITDKGVKVDVSVSEYLSLPKAVQQRLYGYKAGLTFFPRCVYSHGDVYEYGFKNPCGWIDRRILFGCPEVRNEYLAGCIDSMGQIEMNDYLFIPWFDDVVFLARSLGIGVVLFESADENYASLFGRCLKCVPVRKIDIPYAIFKRCTSKYSITVGEALPDTYYGFGVDQNHRFLLGDFTVTHNSCSAISIAEQFQNVFDKRTLVLMPSNLKDNFRKQIFDATKDDQCTGQKYRQMIPSDSLVSKEIIEKRINRVISSRYHFSGFQEFANQVTKMREVMKSEARFIAKLKEQFSNNVIIIDEVHNVREGDGDKLVTPILMLVIQHAENVKLILLSATPMFNDATEIVWLINLLLANDKRKLLDIHKVFDKNAKLTKTGRNLITEACKGYISYMQGENPFSFPIKLYPSANNDSNVQTTPPQLDIKGNPIVQSQKLKMLELIESPLSEKQKIVLDHIKPTDDEDTDANTVTNTQMIQISNIVYPNNLFGSTGFKSSFESDGHKLSYKQGIPEFLSPNLIGEYAPKIERIVNYIKQSKGIVFVYSYYLDSGIIPIALALEHIGFSKYENNNLLKGKVKRGKYTYSIISARKDLTPDLDKELDVLKSEANKEGDLIKVVLGSSVSAEGLDLKCIREIHMLDPWYHLNKVEQIVGRAVRNCSHFALPPSKRNVTVYHHVCTHKTNKKRLETIDERAYRIAENKQHIIDDVEHILRANAIDCHLNKNSFNFKTDITLDIETSQGQLIKRYPLQPKESDNHCATPLSKGSRQVDTSTFSRKFYSEEIANLSRTISQMYTSKHYYVFEDIQKALKNVDNDILMYTLDDMLNNHTEVVHAGIPGYLIYRSNIYMFQPKGTSDTSMPLRTRENYVPKKERHLVIDAVAKKKETVKHMGSLVAYLDNQIAELLSVIKTQLPKQILYDYFIDRIDFATVLQLLSEMFTSEVVNQYIISSLKSAHILVNNTWVRNIFADNPEYQQWNSDTKRFQKVSLREVNSTKLPDILVPSLASLRGYIEKKDRSSKFKIVDSEKSKSNGYVCTATSTLKIDVLRRMITDIMSNAFTDLKKPVLCDVFELILRLDPETFARPYIAKLALAENKNKK